MIDSILYWLGQNSFLFLGIFFSSLGAPIGVVTLLAFGSLASDISSLILVIAVAFVAAFTGDILAYELARKFSTPFHSKLEKLFFFNENESRAKRLIELHGSKMIFLSRWLFSGLCSVISYISGFSKFKRKKFISLVFFGEILFVSIYASLGFLTGEIFRGLLGAINDLFIIIFLLAIIFFLAKSLFYKRKNKLLKDSLKK
jgi:membrane-associated protein